MRRTIAHFWLSKNLNLSVLRSIDLPRELSIWLIFGLYRGHCIRGATRWGSNHVRLVRGVWWWLILSLSHRYQVMNITQSGKFSRNSTLNLNDIEQDEKGASHNITTSQDICIFSERQPHYRSLILQKKLEYHCYFTIGHIKSII